MALAPKPMPNHAEAGPVSVMVALPEAASSESATRTWPSVPTSPPSSSSPSAPDTRCSPGAPPQSGIAGPAARVLKYPLAAAALVASEQPGGFAPLSPVANSNGRQPACAPADAQLDVFGAALASAAAAARQAEAVCSGRAHCPSSWVEPAPPPPSRRVIRSVHGHSSSPLYIASGPVVGASYCFGWGPGL
jgi:hypothetical protein